MPPELHPGEVYWFDFSESTGSEPDKVRPAVIVQSRWVSGLDTVLAVPCTKNLRRREQATGVFLSRSESGLAYDSVAMCHLVSALDLTRIADPSPAGRLPEHSLQKVLHAVAELLDISAETFLAGENPD